MRLRLARHGTGRRCDSGTIVSVALVGDFATAVGGTPGMTDTSVNEVDLKVDGASGALCLISVRTKPAPQDPDAVVLFRR